MTAIRSLRRITLGAALALALAACGSDGDADPAATDPAGTLAPATDAAPIEPSPATETPPATDAPPATETPPATDAAPVTETAPVTDAAPSTAGAEASPSEAPTSDAESPIDGSCLEGDWLIAADQINAYYAALMTNVGGGGDVTISVNDGVGFSFNAGRYVYTVDFALTVDGGGVVATGNAAGTVEGDYLIADGVVSTANDVSAITGTVTVEGITIDATDILNSAIVGTPIANTPFSCDPPTLQFQADVSPDGARYPVVLTPA